MSNKTAKILEGTSSARIAIVENPSGTFSVHPEMQSPLNPDDPTSCWVWKRRVSISPHFGSIDDAEAFAYQNWPWLKGP